MVKDGIKPNIFVYNSIMNVNVGDLDEVQRYYQHMEVPILNSAIICNFSIFYYNIFTSSIGAMITPLMQGPECEGSCFELFGEGE